MSKPIEGQGVSIKGLAFGNVRFSTLIKSGKGVREVETTVDAETILRLADCIRGCQQVYEDPATGAKPHTLDEALSDSRFRPIWIGHALWHAEHPHALMPCLPHGTEILNEQKQPLQLNAAITDGNVTER